MPPPTAERQQEQSIGRIDSRGQAKPNPVKPHPESLVGRVLELARLEPQYSSFNHRFVDQRQRYNGTKRRIQPGAVVWQ
jgi:hypothetical protein